MSTKNIRMLIDAVSELDARATDPVVVAVRMEVEAIEKAARVLETESIGDRVYDVRDRVAGDTTFTGNTWEHPRVVAYGEAAQVISNIAKESK